MGIWCEAGKQWGYGVRQASSGDMVSEAVLCSPGGVAGLKASACTCVPLRAQEWHVIERTYLEGCALGFANIAEQHSLAVAHFDNIKQQFKALLARPDKRVALVTQFQKVWLVYGGVRVQDGLYRCMHTRTMQCT